MEQFETILNSLARKFEEVYVALTSIAGACRDGLLIEDCDLKTASEMLSELRALEADCLEQLSEFSNEPVRSISDMQLLADSYRTTQAVQIRTPFLEFLRIEAIDPDFRAFVSELKDRAKAQLEKDVVDEEMMHLSEDFSIVLSLFDKPYDFSKQDLYERVQGAFGQPIFAAIINFKLRLLDVSTDASQNDTNSEQCLYPTRVQFSDQFKKESELTAEEPIQSESVLDEAEKGNSEDEIGEDATSGQEKEIPHYVRHPKIVHVPGTYHLHSGKVGEKFSTKNFESQMMKFAPAFMCNILIALRFFFHAATVAQLEEYFSLVYHETYTPSLEGETTIVEKSVNALHRYGYLTAIDISGASSAYCLSDDGKAAFVRDSSKKLLHSFSLWRQGVWSYYISKPMPQDVEYDTILVDTLLRNVNVMLKLNRFNPVESSAPVIWYCFEEGCGFCDSALALYKNFSVNLLKGYVREETYDRDIYSIFESLANETENIEIPCFRFIVVETLDEAGTWQQILRENNVKAHILAVGESLACFNENGVVDLEALLGTKPPDNAGEASQMMTQVDTVASVEAHEQMRSQVVDDFSVDVNENEAAAATALSTSSVDIAVPAAGRRVIEELNTAFELAANEQIPAAVLYLKAIALKAQEVLPLYEKVAYALDDPLMNAQYSCSEYDRIFNDFVGTPIDDYFRDCLEVCSLVNVFYAPVNPQDGQLHAFWKRIRSDKSNKVFTDAPKLRELVGILGNFAFEQRIGLQFCTTEDSRAQVALKKEKERIVDAIESKIQSYPDLIANFKSVRHAKVSSLADDLFSKNGEIYGYLRAASNPSTFASSKAFCERFSGASMPAAEKNKEAAISINEQAIRAYLDERWDALDVQTKGKANDPLLGKQQAHFVNKVKEAVELITRYGMLGDQLQTYGDEKQHRAAESCATNVRDLLEDIFTALDALQVESVSAEAGLKIIKHRMRHIYDCLCDKHTGNGQRYFYIDFLKTGCVELNEEYLPCEFVGTDPFLRNHTLSLLEGYSLQGRITKHCELPLRDWGSCIRINFGDDSMVGMEAGDDYGTLSLIRSYLMEAGKLTDDVWPSKYDIETNRRQAEKRLIREEENFVEQIEMAENYGQINDQEKMNSLLNIAHAGRLYAEKSRNYGFYSRMCRACLDRLKKNSESNINKLSGKLSKLRELRDADEDPASWTIVDSVEKMLRGYNYTVAEDYLNLALQNGYKSIPSVVAADEDPLAQFISQYTAIYKSCTEGGSSSLDLSKVYNKFRQNVHASRRPNKNAASAAELVGKWPTGGSSSYRRETLEAFMKQLSFDVVSAAKEQVSLKANIAVFTVKLAPAQYSKEEWKHPIASFGSLAAENGIRVVCLWGAYTPSNLYDIVNNLGSNIKCSCTIVLVDYALARKDREDLAKIIKQARPQHPCIFVDRIMALFLTEYPQLERTNVLLQIALPFSYLQPYVPDSASKMPPEMFIGRRNELKSVLDPSGATLVYGGRQLGKSALLRRAKSMRHDPSQGFYAIFVDIKNRNYDEALSEIVYELAHNCLDIGECSDWDEFGRRIREVISTRRLNYLLLLLDEADTLLSTSANIHYWPLEVMKSVQAHTDSKFKFVLAGLRDVVRFDKSKALRNNSILAHFRHITIKPLNYQEAQSLLQIPLNYLGVRVQPQDIELLSLIFARANYYPSLIHLYCQKLIESLPASRTDSVAAPPYMLSRDLIKKLLTDEDFRKSMRQKLEITLELGDDNYYYKLAVLLAYHHYIGKSGANATAQDIMEISKESGGVLEDDISLAQVEALLDEMVELNVLQVTAEGQSDRRFAFNRYNFTQMLGLDNEDAVFDRLCQYAL